MLDEDAGHIPGPDRWFFSTPFFETYRKPMMFVSCAGSSSGRAYASVCLFVCLSEPFNFGGAWPATTCSCCVSQPKSPQVRLYVSLPLEIAQRKTGVRPKIVKLNVVPRLWSCIHIGIHFRECAQSAALLTICKPKPTPSRRGRDRGL